MSKEIITSCSSTFTPWRTAHWKWFLLLLGVTLHANCTDKRSETLPCLPTEHTGDRCISYRSNRKRSASHGGSHICKGIIQRQKTSSSDRQKKTSSLRMLACFMSLSAKFMETHTRGRGACGGDTGQKQALTPPKPVSRQRRVSSNSYICYTDFIRTQNKVWTSFLH